ncbi:exonuclease 1 [Apium graveolens]|uniref:exonuclease 1 n=1 Tax=Apium graveolens TaxID=4045 RepID=UPI003D7A0102
MGIKDLLRFLKPYVEPIHIKKYAGKRVGIDAYSWLHKGAYSCSMELCLNMDGDKKLQYLKYFMHRINLLRYHKITPVVVFDGGNLPCKAGTENERYMKRKMNRDLAMENKKNGNISAASELFRRAVSITPAMAHQLIQILRLENIEFVVAPYEADAQLAYLSTMAAEQGGIDAVISEDSDLLAYGCPAVIFKMDREGNGEEILMDKLFNSVSCLPSFRNFDINLFLGMCVLAGCDFLPSIPGIGISKAYSLVSKYRNLDRVLSILKFEKGNQVPEDYVKSFKEAIAVFQHARIYDTLSKTLKHMKPLPEITLETLGNELNFLGSDISPSMAISIAEGKLNPCTMKAFPSSDTSYTTTFYDDKLLHEMKTNASQESCFTVVSSHKSIGKRITVMEKEPVLEEMKHLLEPEGKKYLNESLALEKLVMPFRSGSAGEITLVTEKYLPMLPDNNPFKKRKVNEHLVLDNDQAKGFIEPDSVVTEVECLEMGNLEELVLENDQTESFNQQSSTVTKVESLELLYVTPDSQKSVKSKPMKITEEKKGKLVKKIKKSDGTNSENRKNSILNFFTKV